MIAHEPRLLVITLSNIGDLVMTTPVLEALRTAYPSQAIDLVADERSSDLVRHCPYRGELFHRHKRAGWHKLMALVGQLRERRYTLIVDLRTQVLPWVLRACWRLSKRGIKPTGAHAVQEHFATLHGLLGADVAIPAPRVWFDEGARTRADVLLQALPPGRWLALAPGANWPGKIWPVTNFRKLANRCARHFEGVLLVGSPADAATAAALSGALDLPVVALAGRTSLTEAAAVLGRATAFVGNDSGLGHIAAACGVPTMTVFGPGRPERYRPWGPRAAYIVAPDNDLDRLRPELVADRLLEHLRTCP